MSAAPRPQYGGVLKLQTTPPAKADVPLTARATALVFEPLVTVSADGSIRPALATSWDSDASGRRWRFTLRSGVALHDGSTLVPQDVAAALAGQETRWTVTAAGDAISLAASQPMPELLWELASAARHPVRVSREGKAVGSGPFAIDRIEPGGRVVLRAHQGHWAGRPFLDGIEITTAPISRHAADLESGRADIANIAPQDSRRLRPRGFRLVRSNPVELIALALQPNPRPLDVRVRRALSLAIDRQAMADVLLQQQGTAAATLLPDWLTGYGALFQSTSDRAASRTLVASLPPGSNAVTVRFDGSDPLLRLLAERLVADAREVGLSVTLDAADAQSLRPADFRFTRVTLDTLRADRAAAMVMPLVHPRLKPSLPSPPDSGAPLDTILAFERAFLDQHILVPLVHVAEVYATAPRVQSWTGSVILPSFDLDLAGVWIRSKAP